MKPSLVSCIVPVFNDERYLGEALESNLAQTYRAIEIIVVDDGSTDTTPAVAARYGDRILYVRQDNAGAPTARNLGLSLARGEFVAFLDADDLWRPEKLQCQMRRFESRPELDLSVTYLQNFWVAELKSEETGSRATGYRSQYPVTSRRLFWPAGPLSTALDVLTNL